MPRNYWARPVSREERVYASQYSDPNRARNELARYRVDQQMSTEFGAMGTHGTPGLTGKTYRQALAEFNVKYRQQWMTRNPQARTVYETAAPNTYWLRPTGTTRKVAASPTMSRSRTSQSRTPQPRTTRHGGWQRSRPAARMSTVSRSRRGR